MLVLNIEPLNEKKKIFWILIKCINLGTIQFNGWWLLSAVHTLCCAHFGQLRIEGDHLHSTKKLKMVFLCVLYFIFVFFFIFRPKLRNHWNLIEKCCYDCYRLGWNDGICLALPCRCRKLKFCSRIHAFWKKKKCISPNHLQCQNEATKENHDHGMFVGMSAVYSLADHWFYHIRGNKMPAHTFSNSTFYILPILKHIYEITKSCMHPRIKFLLNARLYRHAMLWNRKKTNQNEIRRKKTNEKNDHLKHELENEWRRSSTEQKNVCWKLHSVRCMRSLNSVVQTTENKIKWREKNAPKKNMVKSDFKEQELENVDKDGPKVKRIFNFLT